MDQGPPDFQRSVGKYTAITKIQSGCINEAWSLDNIVEPGHFVRVLDSRIICCPGWKYLQIKEENEEKNIGEALLGCINYLKENKEFYSGHLQLLYRMDDKMDPLQEFDNVLNNYMENINSIDVEKKYTSYYKLLILIKELILTIEYAQSTRGIKEDIINMLQEFKKYYPELDRSLNNRNTPSLRSLAGKPNDYDNLCKQFEYIVNNLWGYPNIPEKNL